MPNQPIPQVGSTTSTVGKLGERPVAALSAAALRMTRRGYDEDQAEFAARAGLATDVVEAAENGTRPVWALPYAEFAALTDTVAALNPWLRTLFETAAACDLLLSCVLDGDHVFATDVLTQPGTRDLAGSLIRLAIAGGPFAPADSGVLLPGDQPLLAADQVVLLRERAAALAASDSPDAWAGRVILAAGWGDQS